MIDNNLKTKPKPKNPTGQSMRLTETEVKVVIRMRQLFKRGADIVIVENRGRQPRIRAVGKPEG